MYLRYFLYLILDWIVTIVGLVLAPILPLFATKEQNLPKWPHGLIP